MKPAWSLTSTGVLPHASANWRTDARVSSEVVRGRTSSTRDITGAGLKKWTDETQDDGPAQRLAARRGHVEGRVRTWCRELPLAAALWALVRAYDRGSFTTVPGQKPVT